MTYKRCMKCGWVGDLENCDTVYSGGFRVSRCPGCDQTGLWEDPWEEPDKAEVTQATLDSSQQGENE